MTAQEVTLLLYNLTLIPMTFFSLLFVLLSILHLCVPPVKRRHKKLKELPFVTVQIPSFNDPIAARCVAHCLDFNYPKDKYEIMIVDDSTNAETQALLAGLAAEHEHVRYIHRTNREGYKPGALKAAMRHVKGELIVLFDADWMPKKNFLQKVVRPFADPKVAIVQTRQGFYNKNTNIITRFAAYTLMIYHTIIMPLHNRANSVFFCGTAGAIRKKAMDAVGGWDPRSITEDAELTVRLLRAGYKTTYLDYTTPSEVPDTFEGFIKQQMRWCYGNARVFLDNAGEVLFKKGLTLQQRLLILYVTLGNIIAPVVVLMTIFGFSGWFIGDPTLMQLQDVITLLGRFALTIGFLLIGSLTLYKQNMLGDIKYLLLGAFTVGLVLSVANTFALYKAFRNTKLGWFCTPKTDNTQLVA
ncbi:MAG: glycosyltransferase [Candidatus Woesearchaeota archaeon]|nr:glycosyltransferase [Candidatus Woesearchaeota archaeon]